MIVGRGKKFCGQHATMEEGGSRRIVCPLDPKHTVTEDKLDKHLKKCNSRDKPKPVRFYFLIQSVRVSQALTTVVVGLQCDVGDSVLSHHVLQDELSNPKNGDSAHKHLKQQVQTHLSTPENTFI
uniref:tRNA:m(4)X modification enzyme TRM13 n=1 Tax=Monopterus albus TaxID=43700 RepID=A0A3Q3RAL0_MONAL